MVQHHYVTDNGIKWLYRDLTDIPIFTRTSFIVVTANNSIGEDVSHKLSYLHDDQSTWLTNSNQRRATGARRIDDCSHPPSHFFSSYCQGVAEFDDSIRSDNPLSVKVNCNDLSSTRNWQDLSLDYHYETFCEETEICVTQWDVPNPMLEAIYGADAAGNTLVDVAWCVSRENFVKIAQKQLGRTPKPDALAAPFTTKGSGQKVHVEASLSDAEGHAARAENILIEAQAPGLVNGDQVWHTLIGGASLCNNCSRLDLNVVPPTTHRLFIHVTMPLEAPNALLYLSSFPV